VERVAKEHLKNCMQVFLYRTSATVTLPRLVWLGLQNCPRNSIRNHDYKSEGKPSAQSAGKKRAKILAKEKLKMIVLPTVTPIC